VTDVDADAGSITGGQGLHTGSFGQLHTSSGQGLQISVQFTTGFTNIGAGGKLLVADFIARRTRAIILLVNTGANYG
jgi:hypothetical protein